MIRLYDLHETEKTFSNEQGKIISRKVVPQAPEKIAKGYELMMYWVLAHEIGHAYHEHDGSFYFNTLATYKEKKQSDNGLKLNNCQKQEQQADHFIIKILKGRKKKQDELYYFLYDLINRDIHKSVCPNISASLHCPNVFPGTGLAITHKYLDAIASREHAPLQYRVLQLIEDLGQLQDWGLLAYQANSVKQGQLRVKNKYAHGSECK